MCTWFTHLLDIDTLFTLARYCFFIHAYNYAVPDTPSTVYMCSTLLANVRSGCEQSVWLDMGTFDWYNHNLRVTAHVQVLTRRQIARPATVCSCQFQLAVGGHHSELRPPTHQGQKRMPSWMQSNRDWTPIDRDHGVQILWCDMKGSRNCKYVEKVL